MKFIISFFILLLSSCGSSHEKQAPITGLDTPSGDIVFQGRTQDRPELFQVFTEVNNCMMSNFAVSNNGQPPLLVLFGDHLFQCGGIFTSGCYFFENNTIYLAEDRENPGMEYLVFGHETIHWITRKRNEIHNTNKEYFEVCLAPYGV